MPRLPSLFTLFLTYLLSTMVLASAYPPAHHHNEARQATKPPVRQTRPVAGPTPKPITIDIYASGKQPPTVNNQPRPAPAPRPVNKAPAPPPAGGPKVNFCGRQPYKPSEYTCYPQNNNFLCPIIGGVKYKPCGGGPVAACYDPDNYDCINGQLVLSNTCGGVVFDTNLYICIQKQLCPKTHANRCGSHCYHTSAYWCDKGVLKQKGQA